jgi:alkaline phosphatase
LAYYETIDLVKKFVDKHPSTVMISVSDHETGGLSLARQVSDEPQYLWYIHFLFKKTLMLNLKLNSYLNLNLFDRYPEPVSRVKNSSFILSQGLLNYWDNDREDYIRNLIRNGLGVEDIDDYDVKWLKENRTQLEYEYFFANITNFRAQLGASALVNLFYYRHLKHK